MPVAVSVRGRSVGGVLSVIEAMRGPVTTLKVSEPCGYRQLTLDVARVFWTSRGSVSCGKARVCDSIL
jgi:hypothetical protein